MKYSVFEAFAGIGGVGLGFERDGRFQVVGGAENNQYARHVWSKAFQLPYEVLQNDMNGVILPEGLDVLCGGFPCQDISVGGTGLGLSGQRSGTWYYMATAIAVFRPRTILIENSDQLITRGLDEILTFLASERYDAEWYTISASAVGAPHRRTRAYVIAYSVEAGVTGLESRLNLSVSGQWDWAGEAHLQELFDRPFDQSDLWPQPLLRRMDDGTTDRSHRLNMIGNSVVVPVIEQLAKRIGDTLDAAA